MGLTLGVDAGGRAHRGIGGRCTCKERSCTIRRRRGIGEDELRSKRRWTRRDLM